jgi:hypothetical protein
VVATIENVKLKISESGPGTGRSIIEYSYDLHPDARDRAERREFSVSVGLWGEDLLDDDVLATQMDKHTVKVRGIDPDETIRLERRFEVETKLLNEDLCGDDEVFLIVEAMCGAERSSGKSNTVIGNF